jgi:epoxyqueuosine reductase
MTGRTELSEFIRSKAAELGFDICGIARARALSEGVSRLENWCDAGMNDTMNYLARDIPKRMDPSVQLPGTRSVIVTGFSYYTDKGQKHPGVPVLSRYAYGETYQTVIKDKLEILLGQIRTACPEAEGKAFSDTAPIAEKRWAVEAGLGWQGKHSIVINREIGSFFFIGILLLNIELVYDSPYSGEMCGNCTKCIDSCPTKAINSDFTIDARKCISNLTIENRAPVPVEMVPFLEGRIYACDNCQEACPWNHRAKNHSHPELDISEELAGMTRADWEALDEAQFKRIFSGTPVGRVKFERFRANLDSILNKR